VQGKSEKVLTNMSNIRKRRRAEEGNEDYKEDNGSIKRNCSETKRFDNYLSS